MEALAQVTYAGAGPSDTSAGFDDTRRQVDALYAELRHQTS